MVNRINILNIWLDPVDMAKIRETVREWIERGDRPHTVFAVNPEKSISASKSLVLSEVLRGADLLIPDGIGVVLAARILKGMKISRVTGADLMESLCEDAAKQGYGIFLFGATETVSRRAATVLCERYPGLIISGRQNGFTKEDEMKKLVQRINRSGAKILFAALGSPQQEIWWANYGTKLNNIRVFQGIGGTLDTIAGTVRRAPKSWQNHGIEWLYRLLSDPRRIIRQKALPIFVWKVFAEKVRLLVRGSDSRLPDTVGPKNELLR